MNMLEDVAQLLAKMETPTVGLLLLAAGVSRRMKGEPKQLLSYKGGE